MVADDVLT